MQTLKILLSKKSSEFGKYFKGSLIKDDGENQNITDEEFADKETNLKINKTANVDEKTTLDIGNKDKIENENSQSQSKTEQGNILDKKVFEVEKKPSVQPGISQISYPKDIEIVFGGSAIFEPGRVNLTNEVIESLMVMIDLIRERKGDYVVLIEGHTDDTDIRTRKYPSNWELRVESGESN